MFASPASFYLIEIANTSIDMGGGVTLLLLPQDDFQYLKDDALRMGRKRGRMTAVKLA